jgi:hypothetical protein
MPKNEFSRLRILGSPEKPFPAYLNFYPSANEFPKIDEQPSRARARLNHSIRAVVKARGIG